MRKLLMAAAPAVGFGAGWVGAEARTVRWSASGDPNTMDPHSQNVGTVTMVLQQIYDTLISRNQDLGLAPGLATRWEQVEPNRWRFWLRDGVKFHEGQAFTGEDVVFSITRAQQPTSNYAIYVDTIDRAVQVEPLVVDVITRVADPILPQDAPQVWEISEALMADAPEDKLSRQFAAGEAVREGEVIGQRASGQPIRAPYDGAVIFASLTAEPGTELCFFCRPSNRLAD